MRQASVRRDVNAMPGKHKQKKQDHEVRQHQREPGHRTGGTVDDQPGNARDREMGRTDVPLGDLGRGRETWKPPAGQQGMSNRPDDGGTATDKNASPLNAQEQDDDGEFEREGETVDQKYGDHSNRAADSGPVGERSALGGQTTPQPRDQDEKGMGHRRNR